ncbi:MAG TPA: potassium channel family protein [Terriglobales bacterium]|nr:potassium channel family protein [Terriglobales bacterium]
MNGISGGLSKLGAAYLQNRYRVLFYTVLSMLVAIPILSALRFSGVLIEWLLAASLLAAIMPVSGVRHRPYLLLGMLAVWLAHPLSVWFDHPLFSAVTLGIWTAIGLLAAQAALRFAMRATAVDAEHLYAALSAYLLAGVFFGLLYFVVEQLSPGAFTSPTHFTQTGAIYFSFVTLATLGYGDIAPRGDIARGIAIVEGVGGQLFLAVLVARLVSLYAKSADDRK